MIKKKKIKRKGGRDREELDGRIIKDTMDTMRCRTIRYKTKMGPDRETPEKVLCTFSGGNK